MRLYFLALGTLLVVCVGCQMDGQQMVDNNEYVAPPAQQLAHPGPMVDGPGPGVMPMLAPPPPRSFQTQSTQVRFVGPDGMHIGWHAGPGYAENQLFTPSRYNFPQGATFRLKLTNIPGREGLVLYPTLQMYPAHPTTDAYLSHNSVPLEITDDFNFNAPNPESNEDSARSGAAWGSGRLSATTGGGSGRCGALHVKSGEVVTLNTDSVPLEITDEDLDQVESNNFVTKVIYLPDPRYQELAIAGVETLVSTKLDPGVDPVAEAERRGTIMLVIRVGNMDLEMPNGLATEDPEGDDGAVEQIGFWQADGDEGQHVPPAPIKVQGSMGVPGPMIVGGPGGPGRPAVNPISGVGGTPVWGMPMTSTPLGLPGPAHLPLGHPAGLQSHTIRNLSNQEIPEPVDHFLIDVKTNPGVRMPKPVRHIEYTENHPVFAPGEVSYPKWAMPGSR